MDTVSSNGPCVDEESGQVYQDEIAEIRRIMIEQEILFKEQVQALHWLYKAQKLEMQEMNKRENHGNVETSELTDRFSSVSEMEDRSGALVRPVAKVYKPESGSFSLHPFCSLKLFGGSGSISFGGSFQRVEDSESKRLRDFDLETFPEGWVDESAIVFQPDDSSPPSKDSEIACVEEDGLLTTFSGKVHSSDTEGNQNSSLADPIDGKAKLSHQDSFASVNGYLNSSSSEGEENNSKIAATFKTTEGLTVAKAEFPKMERTHEGQIPPSLPQCPSSEGNSNLVPRSADCHRWTLKTSSKAIEEQSSDTPVSEALQSTDLTSGDVKTSLNEDGKKEYTQESRAAGTLADVALNKSVQQLEDKTDAKATYFHASSNESSNSNERKHETIEDEASIDKLKKCSESAKIILSRSSP